MTTYTFDSGSNIICQNLSITGTAGLGYISFTNQASAPTGGGVLKVYADNSARLSFGSVTGSMLTIDTSGFTTARTLTIPNITDTLVTNTSTATLTNKTIVGGTSGNIVDANRITGVTISGTPTAGRTIVASSGTAASWSQVPSLNMGVANATSSSSTFVSAFTNGNIVYPGTTVRSLISFSVVLNCPVGSTGAVIIRDVTTGGTPIVCTCSLVGGATNTIVTTTTISNLAATPVIWQIQLARTAGSGTIAFRGYTMTFA